MIGRLSGILAQKQPPQVLVDVQGVGYELDVPMSTFYQLPAVGERVTLHTQLVVREDAQQLYGFLTEAERGTFRQLLKVAGVGARTALAVLSGLSVSELAEAVTRQDSGRLTKIPGIGKKTAERLLLELKDKMGTDVTVGVAGPRPVPVSNDVRHARVALGYNEREALAAIKTVAEGASVAEGIKQALKALSKA
ncbi:MAG: Holliday junction branch migration protein RuvA [Burkholderiales bacterium]